MPPVRQAAFRPPSPIQFDAAGDATFPANVTELGPLSAPSGTFTGPVSATTGTFSGAVSALSLAIANAISAASATFTGAIAAASATLAGALNAGSAAITGALTAASVVVSTTLSVTGAATFAAAVSAASLSVTNAISAATLTATGAINAATLTCTGAISAAGATASQFTGGGGANAPNAAFTASDLSGCIQIGGPAAGNGVRLFCAANGILYLYSGDGSTVSRAIMSRVCDPAGNGITNGATTTVYGSTKVNVASPTQIQTAATLRSGTGAPTVSGANGDVWLRTDGATGSRLYVCSTGTTWTAVAGV